MDLIICFRKADKDKNYSLTSLDNRSLGGFVSPLDVDKDKDEAVELRTLYQLVEPDAAGQLEPDRVLCEVGKLLFKALFVANTSLHEHYRTMDAEDKLVLQFEDGAESLLALPWEYLFDIQERTPVATVRSIVRRVGQTISPKVTEAKTPRALVVIAEPLTLHRFNARNVHDLLLAELEPLVKAGRLHLDFLALPITSERFARQLAQGHYDIVHFVGHGTVGGLAFEDEVGDKQIVDAGRLRALFDGKGVRFVFLTACLSAQGEKPGDLFTNTATALVRAGVGGVLAMQYSALVEPAFAFASDIYRALGEKPLEEAILTARKIRYVADAKGFEAIQWGIPALYLQTENGNLFPKLEETKEKSLGELHPWPKPSLLKGVPERDSEFVGRGAKMVKVNQALAGSKIVALLGSGGLGKTAMATELVWIHRDRGSFSGGIVWVDVSANATLESILNAFGDEVRKLQPERKREVVLNYLANSKMLLVLDNFERLLNIPSENQGAQDTQQSEQDKIVQFLREMPSVSRALLLSREKPNLDETVVDLKELNPEESFSLFIGKAYKAGVRFQERDRQFIGEICEILEGYPLALELAAAQTSAMSLPQLKEALQKNMTKVLKSTRRGLEKRLASVEASLELSYKTLSKSAQTLFKRMSVLVGGGNTLSIPQVCNIKQWETPIKELVNKSLIKFDGNRYMMHPVVRDYARYKLGKHSERTYRRRAADFFLALAHYANEMLAGQNAIAGLSMLDRELDNIYAGIAFSEEIGDWMNLAAYTKNLPQYWDLRGDWIEAESQLKKMVIVARGKLKDERLVALFLHDQGNFHINSSNYSAARECYQQSLEIKSRLGDQVGIAGTLHQLGMIAQGQGDYEEARKLYRQSLEISRRLGNQAGIAITLHQLGMIAQRQGDYEEARKFYGQSLEISHRLGDQVGIAGTLHQLGNIAFSQGNYEEAPKLYQQSLEIKCRLGHQAGVAITLHQLALLEEKQSNLERALSFIRQAESIFVNLGVPECEKAKRVRERIEQALAQKKQQEQK